MTCTCGFENAAGARFCGKCGIALGDTSDAARPAGGTGANNVARPATPRRLSGVGAAVLLLLVVGVGAYWWLNANRTVLRLSGGTSRSTGTFAINPQFADAAPFSEGLAFVLDDTGKIGYIDKAGAMVIAPQFASGTVPAGFNDEGRNYVFRASSFSEGVAAVRIGDPSAFRYGYIDKAGKFVINPQFDYAVDFSEGLAVVRVGPESTGRYGYIDKAGRMTINPQFGFAHDFSEGLAEVNIANKYGYIDKSGAMIVNPISSVGGPRFSDGMAAVMIRDGVNAEAWGFVDRSGKVAINPTFNWAGEFSEGLANVRVGDGQSGKWGYIDKTGAIVIAPQFDWAAPFAEGLATACIGGGQARRCGYIDRTGKIVINLQFDSAETFSEGLGVVRIGDAKTGKYGYVDASGKTIVAPQFDHADPFSDGLARVRIGDSGTGKWGYIWR